jgi:hypothetical protein
VAEPCTIVSAGTDGRAESACPDAATKCARRLQNASGSIARKPVQADPAAPGDRISRLGEHGNSI